MCNSAPKVKPVAAPPEVGAESIDDAAIGERDRERQRQRLRYGRTSTILAGDTSAAMPTASVKTALGADHMCTSRQVIDPGGLLFGDKTAKYADPLGITKTAVGDPTGRVRRARQEAEDERKTFQRSGVTSVAYRSAAPTTALGGTTPRNTLLGGRLMDKMEMRAHCRRRKKAMQDAQTDWVPDWRQVAEYVDPTRGRFYGENDNKPRKRNRAKVINSTATEVLRVMAAGMMSHMTPKAQPWFRVTTPDPAMAEQFGVRVWLDDVAARIRDALASSNFYKAMPVVYTEDGLFGTAPMLILEDPNEVVRFYSLTAGTYAVGLDDQQRVDSLWRRYTKTARQLEQRYGKERLPARVREALPQNGDRTFWVESLIEPNPDERPGIGPLGLQAPQYRAYREVVWIDGCGEGESGVIDIGGHYEAPHVVARWNPVAEDVYSTSPAIDCLGDIKQLQYLEGEKLRLMEQMSDPTLGAPESLRRTGGARLRKGGMIYLPQDSVNANVAPVYTPDPRGLQQIREEIATVEQRIQRSFFYQLFLMLEALGDKTDRTATEIATRKEEKAAVLAPTLESITDEVLDPVIIRVFRLLERAGRIPDPPQILASVPLKIEYTSILAQAAKAAAVGSIERTVQFVAGVAQATGNPSVMDKLDADQVVDEYTAAVGGPAAIVRSDDAVASIRADRAQQQRQQQLAASAQPLKDASQALKTAGEAVPEEGSAAQALIDAMQGAA